MALAGAFGTLTRYFLGGLVQQISFQGFPLGTLVVNILGCFLFGLIWTLAAQRLAISGEMRMIILVGFLGAFTTFSTYAFETTQMLRDSQWLWAALNIFAQTFLGIAAMAMGYSVGKIT